MTDEKAFHVETENIRPQNDSLQEGPIGFSLDTRVSLMETVTDQG